MHNSHVTSFNFFSLRLNVFCQHFSRNLFLKKRNVASNDLRPCERHHSSSFHFCCTRSAPNPPMFVFTRMSLLDVSILRPA